MNDANTKISPVGDLCFDISTLTSATFRVSDFVYSLTKSNRGQHLLSYEKTLRYAEFPPLDMIVEERESFKDGGYLRSNHTEVFSIFDWLEEKGVETIIKLKVPDRLVNPHDELKMAQAVEKFKAEVLDWKVPDLSISTLADDTKQQITALNLYSTGNRAVISHWFSPEGIYQLKRVS